MQLATYEVIPFTSEDAAIFQRLPAQAVETYTSAFLVDSLIMNARARVPASPLCKELMVMRLRSMHRKSAELRRKFLADEADRRFGQPHFGHDSEDL